MKTCSKCGAQCMDEFAFCSACGAKFETEHIQQEKSENNQAEETAGSSMQPESEAGVPMQPAEGSHAQTGEANTPVQPATEPAQPAPAPVLEEPVLIKCEFCGEMVYSNEKTCKTCGAQLNYSKQASIEAATGEFITSNIKKIKEAGTAGISKIKAAVSSVDGNKAKQLMEQYKKYLPFAAAAIVFLILLLVLVPRMAKSPVVNTYGTNQLSYYSAEDEMIFYTNRKVVAEIEDTSGTPVLSMDGSKAAILADYSREDGGSLYLIDSKGEKFIDDNVYYFVMAPSGRAVAYLKDYDSSENSATVMLYNGRKAVKIKSEISTGYLDEGSLVISPGGNAVAYLEFDDYNEFTSYISLNGREPKKLGKYQLVAALSDNAKYIYYIEMDEDRYTGEFYVKTGNNKVKLASDADELGSLMFNEDCSQLLFHFEKKTYLTIKGREKIKILNNRAYPLLPSNAVKMNHIGDNIIYGIDSFSNKLLEASEDIYYLNSRYETNKISDRNYKALISNDMKKLVYLDYSECLHIVTKLNSKNPKDVELDASDDVVNFTISEDGSTIYYVNEDDELYSISVSNRPNKVADDVSKYNLVALGNKIYFLTDYYDTGALYYTTGKRKTAIRNADEVSYAYRLGNGLVYQEGDYDERVIYGSSNGKSFKKLFSAD